MKRLRKKKQSGYDACIFAPVFGDKASISIEKQENNDRCNAGCAYIFYEKGERV